MGDSADVQKLHLHKDDLVFLTSYKDVGKDDQIRNRPTDKYNNSPNKKGNFMFTNIFMIEHVFSISFLFQMDLLCNQAGTLQETPLLIQAVWRI